MKIYKIKVNGKTYKVELESMEEVASSAPVAAPAKAEAKPAAAPTGEGRPIPSPIQGQVIDVKVKVGDHVSKGDVVVIVEAMKLENEVASPFDGTITEVLVSKGSSVTAKQPMFIVK